jgi:hypothetical protein
MLALICDAEALGGLVGVYWLAWLPGPQDTATIDMTTRNRNVTIFIKDLMKYFLL